VDLAGKQFSNQLEFRLTSFNTPGSPSVNINLADYFKISFHLNELGVSKGNLMVTNSQTLEGSADIFKFVFPEPDMKAFSGVLQKGSLSIKCSNTSQITGHINFRLNEVKKNGVPLDISIPLGGNSTTIDLAGAVINFDTNEASPYNQVPYVYSLFVNSTPGYINYSSTDMVKMDVTLNDIGFKSITGDFGKRSITVEPNDFNMNVDLLSKIDGNLTLANPSLMLTIHNSIGMPASMQLEFTATSKEGLVVELNPPAFDIPVPANLNAGIAIKNVPFDKSNSKVIEFIALPPTGKILYSGQIDFNKTPVTAQNPNFMNSDDPFFVDLAMELPMELQISGITINDTSSVSGGDYDLVEAADLIINATNGIPLDFDIQLLFVDTISKVQYGSSEKVRIMSAAKINATTDELTPVKSSKTFSLNKMDMENLRKANGLVFSGVVSSPDNGTTVAPINADSEIKLSVVIKTKVNL